MHYDVIDARYLRDYVIWVNFTVAEYGTTAWPNEADFAPEFLYENVQAGLGK